jgi:hypothetical protein
MSRVNVTITNVRTGPSAALNCARWGVVGLTERGPTNTFTSIKSLDEYQAKLGSRVTYGLLYDCADEFFRDSGGGEMIVGRVVGPAAIAATKTFLDATSAPALVVKANSAGAWGNNVTVQIAAGVTGGTFVLTIRYNGTAVETSPELADAAAAIAWARNSSSYVVISDPGAVADPAVIAATALLTGTDDRASITTAQWITALNSIPAAVGCMQISAPGATTTAIQQAVLDHADANNRVALLDSAPGGVVGTITAAVPSLTGNGLRRGAIVGPWAYIPGLSSGTSRLIPYSAVQAALTAKSDKKGGQTPNVDASVAADNAQSDYVSSLEATFSDADLAFLDAGKVIGAVMVNGKATTYGDRTLANPTSDPQWYQLQSARTIMYVADQASVIGTKYLFKPLDPALVTVGSLKGELVALLDRMSPGQIFNDPGSSVSVTQDTIARKLSATITVAPNQSAETVGINIDVEVQ